MKKLIIPVIVFATYTANAAILPTVATNSVYTTYTDKYIVDEKTRSKPIKFYVSAKGGYNYTLGSIYTDENDNEGFTFSNGSATFSGAIGVDFNYDPAIRLEVEISKVKTVDVKFNDGWDSELHAEAGYTAFAFNFIPYFKISDSVNFDLIFGLGAASLDFADTDDTDSLEIEASEVAFIASFGLGLDFKLTENVSFLPEVKYQFLATTVDYWTYVPYLGTVGAADNSLILHNFQFVAGVKYTF